MLQFCLSPVSALLAVVLPCNLYNCHSNCSVHLKCAGISSIIAQPISKIAMEESEKLKCHGASLLTQRLSNAHIDSVAEQICENDHYVCMAGDIFGPFHLYMTLKQNWNMLEEAQQAMQGYYIYNEATRRRAQPPVNEVHLSPGNFVAYDFENEWHRGKIMKIAKSGREYEVKLIDYGASYWEKNEAFRVLHRNHYTLMAQAISCQLDLSTKDTRLLQQLDVPRKRLVQRALRNILYDRDVIVIFKELSLEGPLKEIKWKVDMYVVDTSENDDLLLHLKEGGTVQKQLLRNLRIANVIP